MEEKVRVHIFVSGIVQGVFFRYWTQKVANKLGLKGWVRNLPDGRVEIVAEGKREKIDKLIEWAQKGPPSAKVDDLEVEYQEYKGEFDCFEIKY